MQITVILGIFLALLVGETAAEMPDWLRWMTGPQTVTLTLGILLLFGSLVHISTKMLITTLENARDISRTLMSLPGRVDLIMRVLVFALFAVQLTLGGWARQVCIDWQFNQWVIVDEILLIVPLLIMILTKWYCFYPVNRFIKEYIVAGQLADGVSARPVWSRRQYMSFQIRHGLLIILVPLLLILAYKDSVELIVHHYNVVQGRLIFGESTEMIKELMIMAGAGCVFLLSPLLIKRIWHTRPLPDGPLRMKLEEFCRQLGFKYRDILLWDTYSAVSNAAVMGLLRPVRYVVISDAVIENMSDQQIEAVFGHEVGHIKHHHILFLMLIIFGAGGLAVSLFELLAHRVGALDVRYSDFIIYGCGAMLVLGWLFLFGFISRCFERQADVYAAWAIDRQSSDSLSNHGAGVMAGALYRIAMLNGISPATRSYRHSSIGSRMEFLNSLADRDGAMAHYAKWMTVIKIALAMAFPLAVVISVYCV
ncbi:MAG: M48 family metalloprotease [Phycisphaerae bacterium]|nr:M48 family metalloprotease [Phycisphaerae bacterium]